MENMKVLIAYDGSHYGDEMLDDLKRAGLPMNCEVVLFSVAELPMLPPPAFGLAGTDLAHEVLTELNRETSAMAEKACQRLRNSFPDWQISAETSFGSPTQEIIKKADQWKPQLIVVGAQGKTLLGRFIFGSVSQKVVTEARCSVRVGRTYPPTGNINNVNSGVKILIGADGSEEAIAAIHAVAARHWPKGSEVRLLTAINKYVMTASHGSGSNNLINTQPYLLNIKKSLAEAHEAELRAAGLSVSFNLTEGDAKHLLVDEAEQWMADVIFVGSRGLGLLKRFLLGSVSSAVVSRAHCSVEVVRSQN